MDRVVELDALRGLAAAVIVVFHLRFATKFPAWGTAVDLFFVLSGYLITRIILDGSDRPGFFRVFYARRALRIVPPYYLAFGLVLLLNRFLPNPDPLDGFGQFLTFTQYVQGHWGGTYPGFCRMFGHTWTLAIEEQFYLIWPLAVRLLGRKGLLTLALPLLVLAAVLRCRGVSPCLLLTRCDGLVLGAVLAAWLGRTCTDEAKAVLRRRFALLAAVAFLASLVGRGRFVPTPGGAVRLGSWQVIVPSLETTVICLLYFGLVGAVACSAGAWWLRPLRARWLRRLGAISYGLYLYHPIVIMMLRVVLKRWGCPITRGVDAVTFALCVLAAALSWRFLEQPVLRLKDRFPYDAPGPPTLRGPHRRLRTGGRRGAGVSP